MHRTLWNTLAAAALVGLAGLSGCNKAADEGTSSTGGAGGDDAASYTFGVIAKSQSNPVFQAARTGAFDAAKAIEEEHGVKVNIRWETPSDEDAQAQAQRIVARDMIDYRSRGVTRAGLLTLDPKGRVLAMVGGQDFVASNWNLAFQARRQAASTAKIATYLAALEAGWGPEAIVMDDPEAIASKFVPRNVDGRYRGRIMLQDCLRESRNVCTLWLAEQVGLEKIAAMASRLGLHDDAVPGSAIVLGAAETTMPRIAAAYLAISNGGDLHRPHVLRAVLGQNGKVLYRADDEPDRQVISTVNAQRMRALLAGVTADGGTGDAAQFKGGRAYGKTGTSQENRDAWFAGFTDLGIVTTVWTGPDEGKLMRHVGGGQLPAEIFADFNVNLVERFEGYIRRQPEDAASFWRDVNVP